MSHEVQTRSAMNPEPPRSESRTITALLVVVGPPIVTIATGTLVLRAWAACDVGVNATANLFGYLIFTGPFLIAPAYAAALLGVLVGRRATPAMGWVTGILLTAAAVYAHLWLFATPADYPSPFCASNVPAWWPWWLPD